MSILQYKFLDVTGFSKNAITIPQRVRGRVEGKASKNILYNIHYSLDTVVIKQRIPTSEIRLYYMNYSMDKAATKMDIHLQKYIVMKT